MAIQTKCQKCNEDFLIVTKEVEAYKEKDLPLPTLCPKHRLERRMNLRNKKELLGYNCDKCGKDIITAVEPIEGLQIYCKACYQEFMENNDCILGQSEGFKASTGATPQAPQGAPTNNSPAENQNVANDPVSW